ncbi:MAG: Flp pilus assembly protein CpaB, partial [Bdellovibrionales bacterium]|nr:Flp pilus assembly protein CpaB [Bdellovibrionales bacterium]
MNQNETRTLWISLITAFAAVFLLYSYTQEKSAELTKDFGTKRNVVVAAEDINEMQTINETQLQMIERPEKFVEPNAVLNVEEAVGLVALAPIKKGEQVLMSKIIKPGPVTGLSLQVAPSKRAIS